MNMMNALDSHSPLEALALDYINVGFQTIVNNLWTWVAVITAAVSFWRIRVATGGAVAATSSDESPSPPQRYDQSSIGSKPVSEIKVPAVLLPRDDDEPVSTSGSGSGSGIREVDYVKSDGVTKGVKFFAAYYEENDGGEDDNGELTAEESGVDGAVKVGEWWDSWERVLRMKMGEMGWYKYQDLTELNGNVVRLWDSSCASTKELKYSSKMISCGVW
ncbi:hypothetical protein ACJW30_07G011500 [Castanea mollissima]